LAVSDGNGAIGKAEIRELAQVILNEAVGHLRRAMNKHRARRPSGANFEATKEGIDKP